VTVIDHLGTVSSKLEHQLEDKTEITQTEQKINFLKQVGMLSTCRLVVFFLEIAVMNSVCHEEIWCNYQK
jgi:hypothetical protein